MPDAPLWVFAAITLFIVSAPIYIYKVWSAPPRISDGAVLIVDLIKTGKDWQKDSYAWFHPSGVNIWIANGEKYVRVNINAKGIGDWTDTNNVKRFDHQEPLSLTYDERALIWSLIEAKPITPPVADTNAVAALAGRIVAMYEDKTNG